jgi:LacI family transcriptional regulator, gluconate utilization system Gnt-I transcriptional repressor
MLAHTFLLTTSKLGDAGIVSPVQSLTGRSRLSDVARQAGVSTMTVTRVLRDPDKVAPATRERVQRTIDAVGYVPDLLARSLTSARTDVVAAVVPTLSNSLIAEVTQGMSQTFARHGRQLMIGASNFSSRTEEEIVRSFLARRVDAIYLTGVSQTPETIRMLFAAGLPVVQGGNIPESPIDMVAGTSNIIASRTLVEGLIRRYGGEIGYIGHDPVDNDRARDRRLGYIAALEAAGVRPRPTWMLQRPLSMAGGADGITAMLALPDKPRAVFCGTDVIATGAIFRCLRAGVRVPQDIAIAGFDDLEIAGQMTPSLSTVRIPRFDIGVRAAEMIDLALAGERPAEPIADMGFEIMWRDSA